MLAARCWPSVVAFLTPLLLTAPALADEQLYHVSGKDSFQIGARDLRGDVVYDGRESLAITKHRRLTRYTAKVAYTRVDQGASSKASALFVSVILPSGEQKDEDNADPDFLTVLNQPFAVQLDMQTLRDVAKLQQAAPFSFSSPMTGAQLHGTLRHLGDGTIAGEKVVGVGFEARGIMKGAVPEHPEISLNGTIRMSGTAYYTEKAALLLALDATMTISGNLADRAASDPVTIVYRRSIKAEEPGPAPTGNATSTRAPKRARPRAVV